MAEQVHKNKQSQKREETEVDENPEAIDVSNVDDILDEIDEVLGENAEEFVKNYVQKGGE